MAAGEHADRAGIDRAEIDRAIRAAEQSSRWEFSVFVGHSEGEPGEYAARLHAALVTPERSVLVMVDPALRALEVVTGRLAREALTDAEVDEVVAEMTRDFAQGDLGPGLVRGIGRLAGHARARRTLPS